MTTQTVTAHVPKDLVSKVDAMAARLDRPRGWAVKEALADWVAVQEERELLTLQAMESVPQGIGIPHGLVTVWFRSLVFHYATLASKAKGLMPPRYEWRLRAL